METRPDGPAGVTRELHAIGVVGEICRSAVSAQAAAEASRHIAAGLRRLGRADGAAVLLVSEASAAVVPDTTLLLPAAVAALRAQPPSTGARWIADPADWIRDATAGGGSPPAAAILIPLIDHVVCGGWALLWWQEEAPAGLSMGDLETAGELVAGALNCRSMAAELNTHIRMLSVRDSTLAAIMRHDAISLLLDEVIDQLRGQLGWDAGAVYLSDDSVSTHRLAAARGFDGGGEGTGSPSCSAEWRLGSAGLEAGYCYLPGGLPAVDAPLSAPAEGWGVWLVAPLPSQEGEIGAICLASRGPRVASPYEGALLRAVALQLGVAVSLLRARARSAESLAALNERWTALHAVGARLAASSESDELLDDIVQNSISLLGATGGALNRLDEATGEMVVAIAYRDGRPLPQRVGRTVPPGEGVTGQVRSTGCPVAVSDYASWPARSPAFSDPPPGAVLAVPLLVQQAVTGVLAVSGPPGAFIDDDLQTLVLFAQQASAVLQSQHARRQAAALAVQNERARVARDLHDGLAQHLASLLLRADVVQASVPMEDRELRRSLEEISLGLQECIREARATIFALRSSDLSDDLAEVVRAQVSGFEAQTGIPVQICATGGRPPVLPPKHREALLHMVKEVLRNVAKHARASAVQLELDWASGEAVRISVHDDGAGFDPDEGPGAQQDRKLRFGLVTIGEEMESLGGSLEVRSVPGRGTSVMAALPLATA